MQSTSCEAKENAKTSIFSANHKEIIFFNSDPVFGKDGNDLSFCL